MIISCSLNFVEIVLVIILYFYVERNEFFIFQRSLKDCFILFLSSNYLVVFRIRQNYYCLLFYFYHKIFYGKISIIIFDNSYLFNILGKQQNDYLLLYLLKIEYKS